MSIQDEIKKIASIDIFAEAKKPELFVCPLDFNCSSVVRSRYSSFLGCRVEIWGMIYYSFTGIVYAGFLFLPDFASLSLAVFTALFSTIAFIFSIYLTLIQLFAIRQWCSWCLISAALSTIIFTASFLALPPDWQIGLNILISNIYLLL